VIREKVVIPSSIEPTETGLINKEDDYFAQMMIELDVAKNMDKKGVLSVIS
jgi:hypothetical protein